MNLYNFAETYILIWFMIYKIYFYRYNKRSFCTTINTDNMILKT